MSTAGGGDQPAGGVVRSSALSFVASAQTTDQDDSKMSQSGKGYYQKDQ